MNNEYTYLFMALGIFLLLAGRPIYRIITNSLDARAQKIADELKNARELKKQAETLLASVENEAKKAEDTAKEIIVNAKEQAKMIAVESEEKLQAEIDRKIKIADERISIAEKSALNQIKKEAVNIAIDTTRDTIQKKMDTKMSDRLIKNALDKISSKKAA